jgi:DNA cross-link repair 1A protein
MSSRPRVPSPDTVDSDDNDLYEAGDEPLMQRFNESGGSVKKRKTSNRTTPPNEAGSNTDVGILAGENDTKVSNFVASETCTPPPPEVSSTKSKKSKRLGPFLSDSESEGEEALDIDNRVVQDVAEVTTKMEFDLEMPNQSKSPSNLVTTKPVKQEEIIENRPVVPSIESVESIESLASRRYKRVPIAEAQAKWEALQPEKLGRSSPVVPDMSNEPELTAILSLKKENTSVDEWDYYDDEDFPQDIDEFADGEEFVERKWMEEQALLEAAEEAQDCDAVTTEIFSEQPADDRMIASCPICDVVLSGITPEEATRHVNGCLDGNNVALPELVKVDSSEIKYMPPEASKRFRKAAIPRPGQVNPFEVSNGDTAPASAFSKLMSGHAEDAAWATAAAAEHSSRGKPAYQRTCPFYKIMPGFFICVDAFRYGAVQGCKAYFLSHFHSDHYVGLTSTWCHGPIYCSKVTGNLVKQQLKVDPKWVVSLDFEERFEVPGTEGVATTMIPANHCPGSSLFLFEKITGRGRSSKIQRVLHCGDFRACPAHIEHPLLMADVVDSINGKTKQQKINVCYLDTTYLNPRYSFPSQEEVITACADMCVSLRKDRAEESDAWEVVKRERAGTGMQKFVQNPTLKAEDSSLAMAIGDTKSRGRLLVVCGTYSIGKERICMGIARALDCKIWAPPGKMRICAALEDPELMSRMTDDPKEAQIHMQMLMELRPETLNDYLTSYKPHFSRIVGFRPSGWNYRPPTSRYEFLPSCMLFLNNQIDSPMHPASQQYSLGVPVSPWRILFPSEAAQKRHLVLVCRTVSIVHSEN